MARGPCAASSRRGRNGHQRSRARGLGWVTPAGKIWRNRRPGAPLVLGSGVAVEEGGGRQPEVGIVGAVAEQAQELVVEQGDLTLPRRTQAGCAARSRMSFLAEKRRRARSGWPDSSSRSAARPFRSVQLASARLGRVRRFLGVGGERRLLDGQGLLAVPGPGVEPAAPAGHVFVGGSRPRPALQVVGGLAHAVGPHHQVRRLPPERLASGRTATAALAISMAPSTSWKALDVAHRHRPAHVARAALPLLLEEREQLLALAGAVGGAAGLLQPARSSRRFRASIQRVTARARRPSRGRRRGRAAVEVGRAARWELAASAFASGSGSKEAFSFRERRASRWTA